MQSNGQDWASTKSNHTSITRPVLRPDQLARYPTYLCDRPYLYLWFPCRKCSYAWSTTSQALCFLQSCAISTMVSRGQTAPVGFPVRAIELATELACAAGATTRRGVKPSIHSRTGGRKMARVGWAGASAASCRFFSHFAYSQLSY